MKNKCTQLIDRLAEGRVKVIGHPVTIGRVLKKIYPYPDGKCLDPYGKEQPQLITLWGLCGFEKSLNQILEEKPEGWEALFEFLIDLFPKEKTNEGNGK